MPIGKTLILRWEASTKQFLWQKVIILWRHFRQSEWMQVIFFFNISLKKKNVKAPLVQIGICRWHGMVHLYKRLEHFCQLILLLQTMEIKQPKKITCFKRVCSKYKKSYYLDYRWQRLPSNHILISENWCFSSRYIWLILNMLSHICKLLAL